MSQSPAIGILGGTFDPVHLGHIKIAECVLQKLKLNEIRFLPNQSPPHRERPQASVQDRVAMLKLAIEPNSHFILDNTELHRSGPSFMVDTLKLLKKKFVNNPLNLIIGADAFFSFNTWNSYEEILDYAHLIVLNRPDGFGHYQSWLKDLLKRRQTKAANDLQKQENGLIYIIHIEPLPISATSIRKKIASAESVANEVPKAVLDYIQSHNLYRNNQ